MYIIDDSKSTQGLVCFNKNFSKEFVASINNKVVFLLATILTCFAHHHHIDHSHNISQSHNFANILLSFLSLFVYFSIETSHDLIIYKLLSISHSSNNNSHASRVFILKNQEFSRNSILNIFLYYF